MRQYVEQYFQEENYWQLLLILRVPISEIVMRPVHDADPGLEDVGLEPQYLQLSSDDLQLGSDRWMGPFHELGHGPVVSFQRGCWSPWFHLSVDFLTDLPDSGGFTAVMVVLDRFSKGCKLIPLKGLPTAMQSAEAMFNHVFRNFSLPEDIVSYRGPQFTSRVWESLCARLGIGVSLSSGYHPQSNGQAERLNQEIGRFLRTYCSREQQRWSEFLPWAEYAQNSLIHSSTGLTPFQCMLGYQPPLFPWSREPSNVPAVEEWYRLSQEVWERAHVRLQRAVQRQRIQADQRRHPHPSYQVGQRVWLSTRNLRLKLPCHKISPKFVGPFEIIRQVNPVSYVPRQAGAPFCQGIYGL
ncbi:hypothetical protein QTP86_018113 [Hemibagrus guttatus]|nr:hypothetical protein QTP86_018113 [Hemibagrus guttatus]